MAYENTYIKKPAVAAGMMLLPTAEEHRKNATVKSGNMDKAIHDFRSSLNVIMGYSELMLDEVLGKMTEEQRDGLKDILTNSQQLLDLVNDIALWKDDGQGAKP